MVMAVLLSVTVSIAAESSGTWRRIFFVSCVSRLTFEGRISEYAGKSRTSSKVKASAIGFMIPPVQSHPNLQDPDHSHPNERGRAHIPGSHANHSRNSERSWIKTRAPLSSVAGPPFRASLQ